MHSILQGWGVILFLLLYTERMASFNCFHNASDYDQKIPQSHTADQLTAP